MKLNLLFLHIVFFCFSIKIIAQNCNTLSNQNPAFIIYSSKAPSTGKIGVHGISENYTHLGDCELLAQEYHYYDLSYLNDEIVTTGTSGVLVSILDDTKNGTDILDEYSNYIPTTFYGPYSIEYSNSGLFYSHDGALYLLNTFDPDILIYEFDSFNGQSIYGLTINEVNELAVIYMTVANKIYKIEQTNSGWSAPSLIHTGTFSLGAIEWYNNTLYFSEENKLYKIDDSGNNLELLHTDDTTLVSKITDITIAKENGAVFFSNYRQHTFSGSLWDISIKKLNANNSVSSLVFKDQDNTDGYSLTAFHGIEVQVANAQLLSNNFTKKDEKTLMYPNPTKDRIHFTKGTYYNMYSNLGTLISKGNLENTAIDISHLKSGIYFIEIDNKETFKIVKQ